MKQVSEPGRVVVIDIKNKIRIASCLLESIRQYVIKTVTIGLNVFIIWIAVERALAYFRMIVMRRRKEISVISVKIFITKLIFDGCDFCLDTTILRSEPSYFYDLHSTWCLPCACDYCVSWIISERRFYFVCDTCIPHICNYVAFDD